MRGWIALLVFLLAGSLPVRSQVAPSEYQLKAVFLFNFAQFVQWPDSAFAAPDAPLVIGVLGVDPFGPVLDEIVQGEKIGARPLTVARYHRVEEAEACHLLFIGISDASRLRDAIAQLKNRPILTVGDTEDFARRGGMIRLASEKNRIRLKINLEAARAAGLTLSSKLLRPAEIVTSGDTAP